MKLGRKITKNTGIMTLKLVKVSIDSAWKTMLPSRIKIIWCIEVSRAISIIIANALLKKKGGGCCIDVKL
jgi:hypothetical protein